MLLLRCIRDASPLRNVIIKDSKSVVHYISYKVSCSGKWQNIDEDLYDNRRFETIHHGVESLKMRKYALVFVVPGFRVSSSLLLFHL